MATARSLLECCLLANVWRSRPEAGLNSNPVHDGLHDETVGREQYRTAWHHEHMLLVSSDAYYVLPSPDSPTTRSSAHPETPNRMRAFATAAISTTARHTSRVREQLLPRFSQRARERTRTRTKGRGQASAARCLEFTSALCGNSGSGWGWGAGTGFERGLISV